MRKNFARKMFGIALAVGGLALFCLASCYEPSPLYGTWSDNIGDKITFSNDYSCTAVIAHPYFNDDGELIKTETDTYSGSFAVVENVISFNCTCELSNGETMNMNAVTEWDIRGSILYLDWTTGADKEVLQLRLYHTK